MGGKMNPLTDRSFASRRRNSQVEWQATARSCLRRGLFNHDQDKARKSNRIGRRTTKRVFIFMFIIYVYKQQFYL